MIAKISFGTVFVLFGIFVVGIFMLSGLKDPHVPGHIRISGEVNTPGQFLIPGRFNSIEIREAIELAGGYSKRANPEKLEVVRDQRRIPINGLKMAMYDSEGFSLFPDDTVVVFGSEGGELQ